MLWYYMYVLRGFCFIIQVFATHVVYRLSLFLQGPLQVRRLES